MRFERVAGAVLTSWFFGLGGGLASLGEMQYALAWASALPIAGVLAGLVSPWCLILVPLVIVASTVHAIVLAHRTDAPFRVLDWHPWAMFAVTVMTAIFLRAFVVEAFKIPSSAMYPTLHIGDHVFIEKLTKLVRAPKRGDIVVFVYPCDPSRDYVKRVIGLPGDTIEVRCNVVYVNGKAVPASQVQGTCTYEDFDESSDRWYEKACSRYHESLDGAEWDVFHNEDRPEHDRLRAEGKLEVGDIRDFPLRDHPFPPSCSDANGGYGEAPPQVKGRLVETKPENGGACGPQYHYVVPDDHVFMLGDNRNNSNDSRVWGSVPIGNVKGRVTGIWWSSHESGRVGAVH